MNRIDASAFSGASRAARPFALYLIRHAESENNAKPVYQRVNDPGITRRGRLQAECLADWMKAVPLDVLITSPFRRTLLTSEAILDRQRCPVHVWHNVFENGGCYDGYDPSSFAGAAGMNRDEIERFFVRENAPASWRAEAVGDVATCDVSLVIDPEIDHRGWWNGQPREEIDATRLRAARVTERLIETFAGSGQTVALVIHADFKRELLRVILQGSLCMETVGPIANASVTMLRYDTPGSWRLDTLNCVTHLPPRLITGVAS